MFVAFASLTLSVIAYYTAYILIGSDAVKKMFIKSGLFGKDMNKKSDELVPEGLGVVSGAVYLVTLFCFIPFPFYQSLVGSPTNFNHLEFSQFICAILSICCMIFLGFTDDVLDLRWRHKLLLPTIASLPLLMVYLVNGGSTTVIVPYPLQSVLGGQLNLRCFYYVYMGMLAVFCTNAINILAGINGVEVGQSVIIAISILLFNLVELTGSNSSQHAFSLHLMLPFAAVSIALLRHNWYPSQVFVGDTFCNFAGMTFAVTGILGHFSKTLLLFFIPQILNFIYSIPQLVHLVPCPRHRLPKYNQSTGLLGMSYAEFTASQVSPHTLRALKGASLLGLVSLETGLGEKGNLVRVNNLTIINFLLKWMGPCHEETLTIYVLAVQVLGSGLAFTIRYGLVHFFYA